MNILFCRCLSPATCIPEFSSTSARNLPSVNSTFLHVGRCIDPCECDDTENEECGLDGNTYMNKCFRECVKVVVSIK